MEDTVGIDKNIFIYEFETIKDSLKKLSNTGHRTLLVIDAKNKLLGTLTDGDIRRYILKGKSLESNVRNVYYKKHIFIKRKEFSIAKAKELLLKNKIELIPIVDENSRAVDIITWQHAFSDGRTLKSLSTKINIPVVVMAGGQGKRLEPFSNIFPKALIPIGEKTIIEMIIDEFKRYGINKYYLTLNHKADMIESYFNHAKIDIEINFIKEKKFLGTAGSLKLLEGRINDVFIVSNCDVIVRADYEEVLNMHKREKVLLTILSSIQHFKIPYGVVKFTENGNVVDLIEKPEYSFMINTGVYILNKEVLEFIPKDVMFDMTDLISILIKNKEKVSTYPVNENDYIDIGQWEEYKKSIEKLQWLK